jgi:hypothetical protein
MNDEQAGRRSAQRTRIVRAAGVDPRELSDRGRAVLDWLARQDEAVVLGLVEMLLAARGCEEARPRGSAPLGRRRRPVTSHDDMAGNSGP